MSLADNVWLVHLTLTALLTHRHFPLEGVAGNFLIRVVADVVSGHPLLLFPWFDKLLGFVESWTTGDFFVLEHIAAVWFGFGLVRGYRIALQF